jgi:hypothetical protein
MGIVEAAVDPRSAPPTPRVERPAGVVLDTIPRDAQLRLGIAPAILEPLSRLLIDADVARIHVLDIPQKNFAAFADRAALSRAFPDLARLPDGAEISSELSLRSPIKIRDAAGGPGAPGSKQAARAWDGPASIGSASIRLASQPARHDSATDSPRPISPQSGTRPFEFVIPKAVISISIKDKPDAELKPYAEVEYELVQGAAASLVRRDFAERALRMDWIGDPIVNAQAHYVSRPGAQTPKDGEIKTDALRQLFVDAWKNWTHNRPAAIKPIPDVDFHFSKLRMNGVEWSPPVISVLFSAPGVKISNSSNTELVYESKGPYTPWSSPITLPPGKSHEYQVADPLLFRRKVGDQYVLFYELPVGAHCEFRPPTTGGQPTLYMIPPTTAAR